MKEKLANTLRIIILSAIFSTVVGYSLADRVAPSGSPPFNNVPPPINVGGATQERAGNLILDNWLIAKKAQTQSTVATKDYVDGQIHGLKGYVDTKVGTSAVPQLYKAPMLTNPLFASGTTENGYLDLIIVQTGPLVTTTSGCHGGSIPTSTLLPSCNGQTTVDPYCTTFVYTGAYPNLTMTMCNVANTKL